jgi:hypothetical protein
MLKNQCRNPRGLDLSLQQSASSWNRSAKTLEAQSFILPTDSPIPAHTTDLGASHCCGRTERLTYDVASPHVVARSRTKSSESLEGSTLLSSENTFPGSQPAPRGGESRRRPCNCIGKVTCMLTRCWPKASKASSKASVACSQQEALSQKGPTRYYVINTPVRGASYEPAGIQ